MARLVAACLTVLALVLPQGARGAVVFGADLTQGVSATGGCGASAGQPCSFFSETTSFGTPETGSPMTGALVSLRLRHYNPYALQIALRAFRATSTPGSYLNVGPEIPTIVPQDTTPGGAVTEYAMHRAIGAGDRLGLGFVKPSYTFYFLAGGSGPHVCRFRQGAGTEHPVDTEASYSTAGCPYEVMISGTVEPDADGDGYGDETQDGCPTDATAQGDCPAAPRAGDTQAPTAKLGGPRTQDALAKRRVFVYATSNEAARLSASGTIRTAGASSVLKLRSVAKSTAAGKRTRLDLKLGRKVVKRVRHALRRGAGVRARVNVTARDAAGNATSAKRTITIKHRR
jgi:hypothetical protein